MKKIMISTAVLALVILSVFVIWRQENIPTRQNEPKPLYWVAPMDPNFKKDKPGKSPMGMDLIPVYDSPANESESNVHISPEVINNLGVRTALVRRESLNQPLQTFGYVAYDENALLHIHPRVEGWVENLYIKSTGEPVTKGAPLYDLYSPQLVNAQGEYLIALRGKDPQYIQAAEGRLRALRFTEPFIAALKKTHDIQQSVTFYSPKTGIIENLDIRQGFFVKPETTMMSIVSLDRVWVEADVIESQAQLIKEGLNATITFASSVSESRQSRIDYIYPTLNPATRTIKVRFKLDNPDHFLKPNMFAHISIHTQPHSNVLVIPKEAVIRDGDQSRVVLALGDGHFSSKAIKPGLITDTKIQVLSGLKEGQKVVTSAQFLIDSESNQKADLQRLESTENPNNHKMKSMKSMKSMGSMGSMGSMKPMDHSLHNMESNHD